jgi:putative phage-type endonuclease
MEIDRKSFIGGSDMPAVMGMSRWKTPLQLWGEKTGLIEQADLSGIEAVELGTELEDFVAKKFERKTGMKVRRAPQIYTGAEPWMKCQVDRLVTGTDELLECKTASAWKLKEWDGEEIPAEYIIQCQWQLAVTGRKVAWIAVLIGGQRFLYKKIEADSELHAKMESQAREFWKMVQDRVPPTAMLGDDQALLALHPTANDTMQAVNSMNEAVRQIKETEMHIARMEEEVDLLKTKLKEVIGDTMGIKTPEYVVTWKNQNQNKLDYDRLKADGLYDRYLKTSSIRVLRIAKNKGV